MAIKKTRFARTCAPIHFEDLDPHRFEDLVRELIYDFRDWQTIEATGRAGGDDGFDIRSFEKVPRTTSSPDEESDEESHPMDAPMRLAESENPSSSAFSSNAWISRTWSHSLAPEVSNAASALLRCGDDGGVDDLPAHRQKAPGAQRLVEASEQGLNGVGLFSA